MNIDYMIYQGEALVSDENGVVNRRTLYENLDNRLVLENIVEKLLEELDSMCSETMYLSSEYSELREEKEKILYTLSHMFHYIFLKENIRKKLVCLEKYRKDLWALRSDKTIQEVDSNEDLEYKYVIPSCDKYCKKYVDISGKNHVLKRKIR